MLGRVLVSRSQYTHADDDHRGQCICTTIAILCVSSWTVSIGSVVADSSNDKKLLIKWETEFLLLCDLHTYSTF